MACGGWETLRSSDDAPGHTQAELQGLRLPVPGRAALLRNKRAAGRTKDLADAEPLERLEAQSPSATSPPS